MKKDNQHQRNPHMVQLKPLQKHAHENQMRVYTLVKSEKGFTFAFYFTESSREVKLPV
jgi:hypothetical protein